MLNRLFTCALLALSLVACGGGADEAADTTQSGGTVSSGGEAPSYDLEMPLARLMSGNVVLAGRVDVAHVRASSLYPRAVEYVRSTQAEARDADFAIALLEKTEELGFAGAIDDAGPDPHLTILRGRFDQQDFERFAALRPDAVAGTYAGAQLFTAGEESLTLVGGRIFLLGSTRTVRAALDRLSQRAPAPEGVAARLLDEERLASSPIAVALVNFDELREEIAEAERAPRELRELVGGTLVMDLSSGLTLGVLADVGTEANANALRNRLRSELTSPAMRVGLGMMGLSGVASAFQFSVEGTATRVDARLDANLLAQVVRALEGLFEETAQSTRGP